jgi:hypothetical protein
VRIYNRVLEPTEVDLPSSFLPFIFVFLLLPLSLSLSSMFFFLSLSPHALSYFSSSGTRGRKKVVRPRNFRAAGHPGEIDLTWSAPVNGRIPGAYSSGGELTAGAHDRDKNVITTTPVTATSDTMRPKKTTTRARPITTSSSR